MKINEVRDAVNKARVKHADMNSAHEGYAVILEELDELWDEVRKQVHDNDAMKKECLHIAAMAVRFIEDICEGEDA